MAAEYPGTATPTIPIPTPGAGVTLNNPPLTGVLTDIRDELVAVTGTLGANPQTVYATVKDRLAAIDAAIAAIPGGGGTAEFTLQVVSDGATNAAPAIQTVLDALPTSTRSLRIVVRGTTKGTIYINSKVRISTSNTTVTFDAPVLVGPAASTGDGFGGFSILGTVNGLTTVSSGATRGSSKIVVAATTNITTNNLIKIYDSDTSGGAGAGQKAEMARVIDISGTTLLLEHPLHHTYTGTINVQPVNPVINSGFDGLNATFSGQQAQGFYFPAKMQYVQFCFFKNMHFRGSVANSWSRECFSVRDAYKCLVDSSSASCAWPTAFSYSYGFSCDNATECIWRSCWTSNLRHGYAADKGSAGLIYTGCISDNTTASGFDLHGGWVRDIIYADCVCTTSDTRNSADGTKVGFLAGNTSFTNGAHWITYVGCVARGFGPYTTAGGATDGEGAGFGVHDGSTNITIQSCRIVDSQFGVWVLSLIGSTASPIKNVTIMDTVFDNISSGPAPLPIWVNAGAAPNDVDGLFIKNNLFVNCANMASARIYGRTGNTLTNVVIEGNTFVGPGVAGVFPLDLRFLDDALITGNTFYKTRRGVSVQGCSGAVVAGNTFHKLADGATASSIVLDSGGANPNLVVANNTITGTAITAVGTAPTSTGASVELMPAPRAYTTAARPPATAVGAGAWYFDLTLGKPGYSNGTVWKDAAGTTI